MEIKKPVFTCEQCNFKCLYKSQYDTHCLTDRHNHVQKETYNCEKCKFVTPYKSVFNVHCASKKHTELATGVIPHNYKPTTNKIHILIEKQNGMTNVIIKIRNDPIKTWTFENDQTNMPYKQFAKLYIDSRYYACVSESNTSWFNEFYNLDARHKLTYILID